jgi:hypothetical protein
MARRVDPCDVIVGFFENAPLEQATMLLTVVRGIVARRQPKTTTLRVRPARYPASGRGAHKGSTPSATSEGTNAVEAETVPPHVKTTKGGLTDDEVVAP